MMWRLPDPRFDVATALDQGNREYQEDSLITDFPVGDDCGIVVLADGMGGHAAGEIASTLVVTEVFSDLKFQKQGFLAKEAELPSILRAALDEANQTMRYHLEENPQAVGMGTTMVSVVMAGPRMYWTSIGDSPLYHFRSGRMEQVNEDHSMAPQIDLLAATGAISFEEAKNHEARNNLTSAIFGGPLPRVDNPNTALELKAGDIVIVSSDGLQSLEDREIAKIVHRNRRKASVDISNALLQAVKKLGRPEQDNISIAVIKVNRVDPPVIPPMPAYDEVEEAISATTATKLAGAEIIGQMGINIDETGSHRHDAVVLKEAANQ